MMYDYLVVGSGLYGAIFAHEAKAHGKSVLVVDKRPNIAGNIVFLCRKPRSRKAISLVLFETWGHTFYMHAMFIINNIMFIPFGVLLPILFGKYKNG